MNVRPLGRRLLVKMLPDPTMTESGLIYLPDDTHQDAIGCGIVQAVGPGKVTKKGVLVPVEGVKPGDKVYFIKFLRDVHTNVSVAKIIGNDLILIDVTDILGVEDAGS